MDHEQTDLICTRAAEAVGYVVPGEPRESIDRKMLVYNAACAVGNWELAVHEERDDEDAARWKAVQP